MADFKLNILKKRVCFFFKFDVLEFYRLRNWKNHDWKNQILRIVPEKNQKVRPFQFGGFSKM